MRPRHPFRNPLFLTLLAACLGICGILGYLLFQSFTTFDTLVEYEPGAPGYMPAREWGSASSGSRLDTAGTPEASGRNSALPRRAHPAMSASGTPSGVERLVATSLKNPVNRKVSLYIADRTFKGLVERSEPGSAVEADIIYMHALFDSVRNRLEEGALDEAGISRALRQGEALMRDRRLTPSEFDRLAATVGKELGFRFAPHELRDVLERMRQPAHRGELKRLVQEEAGGITNALIRNPVSRRMSVFMARQVFKRHEQRICAKLPPGMSCNQARTMFENTMQGIVRQQIDGNEAAALAGKLTDILIDRRVTPREMKQLLVFIKQVSM